MVTGPISDLVGAATWPHPVVRAPGLQAGPIGQVQHHARVPEVVESDLQELGSSQRREQLLLDRCIGIE
ncbi:MAG: hypothetical protein ACREJ6_02085 [Candidatus Methylomirabilis sp.]